MLFMQKANSRDPSSKPRGNAKTKSKQKKGLASLRRANMPQLPKKRFKADSKNNVTKISRKAHGC
jgi:hypothetical protein